MKTSAKYIRQVAGP